MLPLLFLRMLFMFRAVAVLLSGPVLAGEAEVLVDHELADDGVCASKDSKADNDS